MLQSCLSPKVNINSAKPDFLSSEPNISPVGPQKEKGLAPLMHILQRPCISTGRILQPQPPNSAVHKVADPFSGILDFSGQGGNGLAFCAQSRYRAPDVRAAPFAQDLDDGLRLGAFLKHA